MGTSNGSAPHRKVLIVDDDEEIRHVLRLMCETEGFEVVGEAENGVEAVPLALKHQPDFVILDYLMPHLDGEGTATMLRAIAPEAKIIAFSAVLDSKPAWSDSYLNKARVSEVAPLLERLIRH
ncbi:MAG: response regulator [Actinobacteria bacterium]|nr:response regulator [Actinomycetota bacterium]